MRLAPYPPICLRDPIQTPFCDLFSLKQGSNRRGSAFAKDFASIMADKGLISSGQATIK
jgi:hypothetical protein